LTTSPFPQDELALITLPSNKHLHLQGAGGTGLHVDEAGLLQRPQCQDARFVNAVSFDGHGVPNPVKVLKRDLTGPRHRPRS
jgi:hypothetical protein